VPLADVLVSAVDPVVWQNYEAARQQRFGEAIKQARLQVANLAKAAGQDRLTDRR